MDRALALARGGWGRVHPNPLVGAVVVSEGRITGSGWHAEYGGPHAEVVALGEAGETARGSTLYVTLEPCSHHGKTPPCTDSIAAAGVARVVYGAADSDRRAAGGAAVLEALGIDVTGGVRVEESRRLNVAFHHVHETGTPFVTLKLAMSVDGRLSRKTGARSVVTGEAAVADVHRLRAGFDAILIGSGTARTDDPELTVRGDVRPRVPPVRIVLDSSAATPTDSALVRSARTTPVWILMGPDANPENIMTLQAAGVRTLPVGAGKHGGLDISEAFSRLWQQGVRTILCEGGGRLAASLLESDVVKRIHLYVAPDFFGPDGPPAFPLRRALDGWFMVEARGIGRDTLLILEKRASES